MVSLPRNETEELVDLPIFIGLLNILGVLPRLLHPKMRKTYPEIEKKISLITDNQRTLVDLYKGVKSTKATRETRMEVVAWIAVCKFQCKLEGGFVRDWVVGKSI